jgi:hypothetical protein
VESTSARDFNELKGWFENDEQESAAVKEFLESFRSLNLKGETNKSSAIYKAIFNLLVISEARDWITFDLPEYSALDDHHIVPASWEVKGINNSIQSILNRTPLSEDTNRKIIRNRMPNEYLIDLFNQHGKPETLQMLQTHLISAKAVDILLRPSFAPEDYQEFLEERQRTILSSIQDLLIKDRINYPVDLRVLDVQIEKVELAIRSLIADRLANDSSNLPQHIRETVNQRIQMELRKHPWRSEEDFGHLSKQLQFFDIGDCRDIILNKAYWPKFESIFSTKELFSQRITQLSNLRNSIRHSREVDQVQRMDGEAAITWVSQALRIISKNS